MRCAICGSPDPDIDEGRCMDCISAGIAAREAMQQHPDDDKKWRTVIVGLPILRKLLNGEDVTLNDFHINLIPDDVLFNNRPTPRCQAAHPEGGQCELRAGHKFEKHLAGMILWPREMS